MKKALSLMLACLMLIGMLAACSSEPAAPTTPSDTPAVDTPVENTPAEEPAEAPVEEPAEEPVEEPAEEPAEEPVEEPADEPVAEGPVAWADLPPTTLPITTEPTTFTCWISDAALPDVKTGVTDLNEIQVFQKLEELTNVHWEFELAQNTALTEKFNLMIMSGQWADLISGTPQLFAGGYDKYIEDEIIIDIKDLVEENAPHYWALINEDETVRKELLTDSGYMSGFQQLYPTVEPSWLGYFVRQDLVEAAGMTELVTYDDWTQFLKWNAENTDAIGLFMNSNSAQDGNIMAGFGASAGMLQKDGKVFFSPITDEYKAYLELVTDWYAAGYIDKDFASSSFFPSSARFGAGEFAIFPHMYSRYDMIQGMGVAENPDFQIRAVSMPVINAGDKVIVNPGMLDSRLGGQRASISTTCEDPALLTAWYDYLYSEEGAFLGNFGIEGEAHTIVDGEVVPTDALVNNPNGWAYSEVMNLYIMPSFFPYYYDWSRGQLSGYSPEAIESTHIWFSNWDIPNQMSMSAYVSLTTEESEDIGSTYADITTYVQEFTAKVMTGEESIDNWDAYVANIEGMGIEDIVETYQVAYDRYLAR